MPGRAGWFCGRRARARRVTRALCRASQAFIFTLLWRDAAIFFGDIRGTLFTLLVLLPTVLMSWKVTPKILSNFCFASAVAKLDKDILHEMMEELTQSGDYTAAGQVGLGREGSGAM